MEHLVKTEVGGRTLSIRTGKLAKQASGSAVVQYGETVILVCAVSSTVEKEVNFLPLSVEYQEKIYSSGRIPGNYFRREVGRPSEKEILTARIIDRPIRPLFPKKYNFETQIIATVLSMDKENDPDVLALIGASVALDISHIPFDGPIAGVRVGRINGEFVINPTIQEMQTSDINILVAGSKTGIVMVEGDCSMVSEADVLDAIFFGHEAMKPIIKIQEELKKNAGVVKMEFKEPEKDPLLEEKLKNEAYSRIKEKLLIPEKIKRNAAFLSLKKEIFEELGDEYKERKDEVLDIFSDIKKKTCRELIIKESKRIDGRGFEDIRPISCEAGILPRTHGSALFTRGETQVLGVMTLGSGQDEQRIETLSGDEKRQFMLHYNFPPYSVGEVKRIGGPSRRDIGHGGLSCRAIEKVLPPKEEFDYTIRIVSEVLESNGSSSMGTVCAGVLSLMDGGVPIKEPVAGIAMGLVKEGDNTVILSDILGDEDHAGDMDFKVTGTKDGITAIQMDIKISELSKDILEKALNQAKDGRIFILNKMLEALKEPRVEISPYAPKILTYQISKDKIGELIGPGGKNIKKIQADTNTRVEVDETGMVKIAADSLKDAQEAKEIIVALSQVPEEGQIYEGKVVKIMDFGAFVRILDTDGLVHISQIANYHVKKVTDVVREGDIVKVKVLERTREGKLRLSIKDAK
jgi:polyribonucleotide nucleotidyltransferase